MIILQKADGITTEQAKNLYNMNINGWISSCTRNDLLWGECTGNSEHVHFFNYFGVPSTFKVVIINNDTGEIKVTGVITRQELQSDITINVDTMRSYRNKSNLNIIGSLILTIVIEIVIALIMKIKHIKLIFIVNLITNIILQLVLMYIPLPYMFLFLIMEITVIVSEYLIYEKYFTNISEKKIISYTLIANILSALLTFI